MGHYRLMAQSDVAMVVVENSTVDYSVRYFNISQNQTPIS